VGEALRAPLLSEASQKDVLRAAGSVRLKLPRLALGGRAGDLASNVVGSSLEFHDFRDYQPGDDVRQLDWSALARTGRPILRTRRAEVAPRTEIVVDGSRSMQATPEKAQRAQELALLLERVSRAQGLPPHVYWAGARAQRVDALPAAFDGREPLPFALPRLGLKTCGVRVVVSDLLFEGPLRPLFARLAEGASLLAFVQVLSREDRDPEPVGGAQLTDVETDEKLDQLVSEDAVANYLARLKAHQGLLDMEASRVRALVLRVNAEGPLDAAVRQSLLGGLLEPRRAA
jgi:uncharacterized protein (DUF58 family)